MSRFSGVGQMQQNGPSNNVRAAINELGGGSIFTRDFAYAYTFQFRAVPQNGSQARTKSIDLGTGFLVTEIAASARFAPTNTPTGLAPTSKLLRNLTTIPTGTLPLVLADIGMVGVRVTQTDRPWYDGIVPLDQVSGDTANPYILSAPIWIAQKTDVSVEVFNRLPALTGAATPAIDIDYTLIGLKMVINQTVGRA